MEQYKVKYKENKEAWSEQVVDKAAYDETIVDQAAYDEEVFQYTQWIQRDTGEDVTDVYVLDWCEAHNCKYCFGGDGPCASNASGRNIYKTVHHDAVTHTVHHDATYKTVNHPAETHTETYCTTCGATK